MVHGEGLGDHVVALVALALWAVAGIVLAVRGFSWEARRQLIGCRPGPQRVRRLGRRASRTSARDECEVVTSRLHH